MLGINKVTTFFYSCIDVVRSNKSSQRFYSLTISRVHEVGDWFQTITKPLRNFKWIKDLKEVAYSLSKFNFFKKVEPNLEAERLKKQDKLEKEALWIKALQTEQEYLYPLRMIHPLQEDRSLEELLELSIEPVNPLNRFQRQEILNPIFTMQWKPHPDLGEKVFHLHLIDANLSAALSCRQLRGNIKEEVQLKMQSYPIATKDSAVLKDGETTIDPNFFPATFKTFKTFKKDLKPLRFNLNREMENHFYSVEVKALGQDTSHVYFYIEIKSQLEEIKKFLQTKPSIETLLKKAGHEKKPCLEQFIQGLDLKPIRDALNIVEITKDA